MGMVRQPKHVEATCESVELEINYHLYLIVDKPSGRTQVKTFNDCDWRIYWKNHDGDSRE